jgi:hypothetical protein
MLVNDLSNMSGWEKIAILTNAAAAPITVIRELLGAFGHLNGAL